MNSVRKPARNAVPASPARRRWLPLTVAAGLAVALVVGGGILLHRRSQLPEPQTARAPENAPKGEMVVLQMPEPVPALPPPPPVSVKPPVPPPVPEPPPLAPVTPKPEKPTPPPAPVQKPVPVTYALERLPVLQASRLLHGAAAGYGFAYVALTSDGRYAWYRAEDSRLVDLKTGKNLGSYPAPRPLVTNLALTPDGRQALVLTLGSRPGEAVLRLWNVPAVKPVRTYKNPERGIEVMTVSPDGRLVATGRGGVGRPGGNGLYFEDCGVRVWELATGRVLCDWDWSGKPVDRVAFSPDGRRAYALRTQDLRGTVRIFDLAGGPALPPLASPAGKGQFYDLAVSPDGRSLLVGSLGAALLLDAERGTELRRFPQPGGALSVAWCGPRHVLTGHGGAAIEGAGLGEKGEIVLWEADTGRPVQRLLGNTGAVTRIVTSTDGRRVLSAGDNSMVCLWDLPPT